MTLPSFDVQVAFAKNPRDDPVAGGDWTSLVGPNTKSSLLHGRISRGRSHMAQHFEAGTAELDLNNNENYYDPAFTTGPHGANLKPLKPVRVIGNDGTTDHTLFRGFTDRWAVKRQAQNTSVVELSAFDVFGLLATKRLRDTAYLDAVNALSPDWFWRFNDHLTPSNTTATGTIVAVTGPDLDQLYVPQSVDGPLVTDPDPALSLDGDKGWILGGTSSSELGLHARYSVAFWMKTSSTGIQVTTPADPSTNPGGTAPIIWTFGNFGGSAVTCWALWLGNLGSPDNTTVLYHVVDDPAAGVVAGINTDKDVLINDGQWHHVVITRDAGWTQRIYVDGVLKATAANPAATATPTQLDFQIAHDAAGPTGGNHIAVDLKDMAWWFATTLSGTDVLNLYNAGIFPAETVGDRLNRCLDIVGVPAGWRDLDAGPDLVAYTQPLHHTFALDHMQTSVDSEAGQLFTTADGIITYDQRTHAAPSVSATFSDTASGAEIPYQPSDGPQIGPEDVYNEIDISGPAIQPVLLTDSTSDDEFGTRTYTISNCQLANQSDADAVGAALLARLKDAVPTVPGVNWTCPDAAGGAFAQAVTGELMDRVTLKEQGPVLSGSPATQTSYVEHIDLEIVPGALFAVAYALSPF